MGDDNIKFPQGTKPVPQEQYVAKRDKTNVVINYRPPIEKYKPETEEEKCTKILTNAIKTVIPDASDKFISQIQEMAEKLGCNALDVAALIFKESSFNPKSQCGSFHGLGQMDERSLKYSIEYASENPEDAKGINPNMTMKKFVTLSREEQMPYVKNYALTMKKMYLKNKEKLTGGDLYALFLTPAFSKGDELLNANSKNERIRKMYASNKGLDKIDKNKTECSDGKITKDDLQYTLDSIKIDVFKLSSNDIKRLNQKV